MQSKQIQLYNIGGMTTEEYMDNTPVSAIWLVTPFSEKGKMWKEKLFDDYVSLSKKLTSDILMRWEEIIVNNFYYGHANNYESEEIKIRGEIIIKQLLCKLNDIYKEYVEVKIHESYKQNYLKGTEEVVKKPINDLIVRLGSLDDKITKLRSLREEKMNKFYCRIFEGMKNNTPAEETPVEETTRLIVLQYHFECLCAILDA